MNKIKISIKGDIKTREMLNFVSSYFKEPVEPLEHSAKVYLASIASNFKNEGRTFGQPWQPLKPSTIAIKRKLYKEGKSKAITKPLVRTGALRSGFKSDMPDKKTAKIYNVKDYAKLHQSGGSVSFHGRKVHIPKRVLAAIDSTRIKMVGKVFTDWIQSLITKSKK